MKTRFLLSFLLISSLLSAQQSKTTLNKKSGRDGESYRSATFNGVWHWFTNPRAVYHEGKYKRTYTAWVDNYGDATVGYYDQATGAMVTHVVADRLEVSDHNNPVISFDEEGHIMLFFNNRIDGNVPVIFLKSKNPEDISQWSEPKTLYLNDAQLNPKTGTSGSHRLVHPVKLSAEKGKIFLFWHGPDFRPTMSTSTDNGETWSAGKAYFEPELAAGKGNAFVQIYSDGIDKIHFFATDGSPRKKYNALHYFYYTKGAFYKANGQKIGTLADMPLPSAKTDVVYDATSSQQDAFTWDVAQDATGKPVVAYVKFRNDSTHCICYARWNGAGWENRELINAGGWFPKTQKGKTETEPFYSGGVTIDKENPNQLYLSLKRDSVFEIEKWTTKDFGKSWKAEYVTRGSSKDNVRPTAVLGAREGNPLQLLWMQNTRYIRFNAAPVEWKERYQVAIKTNLPSPAVTNALDTTAIKNLMRRTADWQLANPRKDDLRDWHYAAFFVGLMDLWKTTGDERYLNEMYNLGQQTGWKPLDEILHADRVAIIDMFIKLYEVYQDPVIIDKSRWALDIIMSRGTGKRVMVKLKDNLYASEWITWCDALFMSPPVFAQMTKVTGDQRYLKYMDIMWGKTSDYLYSKSDSLFFRDDRYISKLSDNGKKIFWSRGNGWVIAGLARILEVLPKDSPIRPKYEQQYKEMAHKLLSLQLKDGLWTCSLLDPAYLPDGESSGSAFFCYGLAYGLNNGLLDAKYRPNVEKAWVALSKNVNATGRLGYVQQVAGDPYPFTADQSHVYATGAYLSAGKEMLILQQKK